MFEKLHKWFTATTAVHRNEVHKRTRPRLRLRGLRQLAIFPLALDHLVQRLAVVVGELGAGEVVAGHGLYERHGLADLAHEARSAMWIRRKRTL
ncbi:hypothetical protein UK15_39105 [Streptomyces variegatus]|uniref:Uncharacterized protein n=1 Tax=Streptomyces variegatus TaxID=284040 RepID=A0A0M2GG35_9ACTN|nr:hypothetical protein UK15_39105 [Streptomyces variegatus]